MSTNKNALIRYKVLDKCFRNPGKRYFIEDLIGECTKVLLEMDRGSGGISRRQIFEDISFMESREGWSVDLDKLKDGRRVYYRYAESSFSINKMPLNEVEINQLKSAVDILSQFKGMPQFEWIHELVPKLEQGLISDEVSPTIIEFDANQYLKGIEHLGVLHNAILYKKVLSIAYQPFQNGAPFEVILHPYYLKQYNSRWFLFGYNPDKDRYDWNLALDRMVEIEERSGQYHGNMKIDWTNYFDDIIGVTKSAEARVEDVTLRFTGMSGKYMESKPLHGSQRSRWIDADTLEVNLKLIINYELERLILSYAESVKVLSPESLAAKVFVRLGRAIMMYKP